MVYTRKEYFKMGFVILALGLSQCGKKTESQNVLITAVPESPVTITSDMTLIRGGAPIVVKAPWFKFSVRINNTNVGKPVTIVGLHVEVTGVDAQGNQQTKSKDIDPGQENFTNASIVCNYTDFGQFDAAAPSLGDVCHTYPATNPLHCPDAPVNNEKLYVTNPITGCPNNLTLVFYIGDNPKPADLSFVRYQVKVKPIGWFGTRSEPAGRFENYATFSTQ